MNKIDFALASFSNIQSLIKFIDQKTSAVLVISGLVFTGLLQFSKDFDFIYKNGATTAWFIALISMTLVIICLITITYISIYKVLKPRKAESYKQGENSLFYYEHLSKLGKKAISENYEDLTDKEILKNLIDQQYELSKILERKSSALSLSLSLLFFSILCLVVFIISSKFIC